MPPKSTLFGGFGDPTYISTDPDPNKTDPYIKPEPIPSRYLGSNFKVPRASKGKLPKAFLEKAYKTLASSEQNKGNGDVFVDPGVHERKAATEAKKKNIDKSKDFKYPSAPKMSTGPGSYVGTFQGKPFDHEPSYKVPQRNEAPPHPKPQPKNFGTTYPKKGTYGYIGTTFSKIESLWQKNPEKYQPDVYDALRKAEGEAWKKSQEKFITKNVFKIPLRQRKTFDEKMLSGVSAAYDAFVGKEGKEKVEKKVEKPKLISDKPFKFSSPAKSGQQGCFAKYPNDRGDKPDPYDTMRLKRKEEKEKAPKCLGGAWKPVAGSKSAVIRSLLRRFY